MTHLNRVQCGRLPKFRSFIALAAAPLAILPGALLAQTVINAPPTVIDSFFDLNDGVTLNVGPGGEVGGQFDALSGSVVNVAGGVVGEGFEAKSGSEVSLSGGSLGAGFDARDGSVVELVGGEFYLNGVEYLGDSIRLDAEDVLTGTLADGSVFLFSDPVGDDIEVEMTLSRVPLPPIDLTPVEVSTAVAGGPFGLRSGQTLTLKPGGVAPGFPAVFEGTLNIDGGSVTNGLEVYGGVINLTAGTLADDVDTFGGSRIDLSGGLAGNIQIHQGAASRCQAARFAEAEDRRR